MSRWNPNARERLQQAAYDLFRDVGYDRTTVVDIATRAGLTERTFFRHYADKREVLFGGSTILQDTMLRALREAPAGTPAFAAIRVAMLAASDIMRGRRELARERHRVIEAHPDLQERGYIKRAALTAGLTEALHERGERELEASLAANMAIAVFYVAFDRWVAGDTTAELVGFVAEGFDRLKAVASAG